MLDLTVGQAAGVINVAVLVAQLTLPLAVVCVLAGLLKESNNAVTWSVVGGILNASAWPTILRTDTAASTRVDKRVVLISIFSTVGLILLAAVSIVTPLGLYENISHGSFEEVEFGYTPDLQPIGKGTPQRADYNVSRICGDDPLRDCPGQSQGFKVSFDELGFPFYQDDDAWMSSVLPSNLTEIFSSGSKNDRSLVAGAFDIEYRSFVQASNDTSDSTPSGALNVDQGRKRTQATFRMYESLILKNQVNVVDGLIVDTKVGGIGFRNHTVPIDPGRGSEWTEGLLWIQPETVCIPTNISFEYTIPESLAEGSDVDLIDGGGFSGSAEDSPPLNLNDTQTRPELFARAHKGATCNSLNLMANMGVLLNQTAIGGTYEIGGAPHWQNRVSIARFQAPPMSDNMIPELFIPEEYTYVDDPSDFCDPTVLVDGYKYNDLANISNIAIGAGLMLGATRRSDGASDRLDPGSKWRAPLHSCATALKAHIMDVSFQINGTNSLTNLQVTSMKPRIYSSHASLPLWAVEDTGLTIGDVGPFWAIVDDKYEYSPHLWTSRKEHLYLPAGAGTFSWDLTSNSASASTQAPQAALNAVYRNFAEMRSDIHLPDYSGFTNYPLFLKWQDLSQSPDTAPAIINLIWTDIMANYVVCTRSTLNAGNTFADNLVNSTARDAKGPMIRVLRFRRRIQYDLRYGIPGVIFLAFHVMAIFLALTFWVTGRVHFTYLRTLLNQTATGRCVMVERYGDAARAPIVGTRRWVQAYGDEDLGFRRGPLAEKHDSESQNSAITTSPPSVPEDEELLSVVERPLEQEEQTAHQDMSTEMRLVPSRE